jgi:RNA polymerase sigma-70 factor (ECF subfamily)
MVQIQAPDTSPRARRHERLEAVVAAFETPLLRYAARLLHNPAMAQDVAQNVFIKLFRLHDRQAADAAVGCPDGVHCDPPPDDRIARVMHALDALGLPERQVLLLRLQEGLSYEEIAGVTGRSSGYVGTLLHQAVKKLAATIQQQEGA